MVSLKKQLTITLFVLLMFSVFAVACTNNEPGQNEESKGQNQQDEPENQGNQENEKTEEPEETVDLTMFMSSSGAARPPEADPNNNKYVDFIEKYANVDLDFEMPQSTNDEQTRLNLLLASGNLPDIVHARDIEQADQVARYGGFIDLTEYYENSPDVQKIISAEMMEHVRDSYTDGLFRIPMAWDGAQQGYGNVVRYDMIKKYNDGVFPESVDEWVDLLRVIHKAEPDSILLTNRVIGDHGITYGGNVVFQWFGIRPFSFRVEDGEVINQFRTAEYKAAVEVLKQLYDEGIVDPEFPTADSSRYGRNLVYNNTIMWSDDATQVMPMATAWRQGESTEDYQIIYAPPLKVLPEAVKDPKYTLPKASIPIAEHGLYISSKSENPDRAWKVIEGFVQDELKDMIFWGEEGEQYTVESNKRVPISEGMNDPMHGFGHAYATVFGFHNNRDLKYAQADQVLETDYLDDMVDSLNTMEERALQGGIKVTNLIDLPDDAAKKIPDTRVFITQATLEAMMGKITMEQFDERVQQYIEEFGFIDDAYTEYMNEHKDELRAKGAVEVDW